VLRMKNVCTISKMSCKGMQLQIFANILKPGLMMMTVLMWEMNQLQTTVTGFVHHFLVVQGL